MSRKEQKERYKNAKKRREGGQFVALPWAVLRSDEFAALSPFASKLLFDLLAQFNGGNNGDLCAAWRLMKVRGWRSKDSLWKGLSELRAGDWLETTRQGGRHVATLYAVSFYAIDYCGGKLDVKETGSPSGAWRKRPPPPLPAIAERPQALIPPSSVAAITAEPRKVTVTHLRRKKLLPRQPGQLPVAGDVKARHFEDGRAMGR